MNGGELLGGLWAASLSATVIILTVLLLRMMFQSRTPGRVFCLLWDVAIVRLLVLDALPSPVSVWQWFPASSPAPTPGVSYAVTPGMNAPAGQIITAGGAAIPDIMISPPALLPDKGAVLVVVWLAAALALAAWFLWSHLCSRRVYAESLPCEDVFVRDWLAVHPLRRRVQVRTCDRIAAPLTYGILRPIVLLPSGMDWMDRTALSCVLEHEYQHIRYFDTLRKMLLAAVLCLHWFNPLVWVMYVLCNRDVELACDEAVTICGVDRADYAQILLDMEEQRGQWGLSGSHFSQNALEERIKMIMKQKHLSLAALIAVVMIMSITVTVFAAAAPETIVDKNGGVVEAVALGSGTLSVTEIYTFDEKDAVVPEAVDADALQEELKPFGIGGSTAQMTYNGQLVRYFVDGVPVGDSGYSIQYVYSNPDGVVDVHTLRSVIRNPDGSYDPMGKLIGVAAEGDQGFDRILIESAIFSGSIQVTTAEGNSSGRGTTFEEIFAQYKPYGLVYSSRGSSMGSLTWNGQAVKSFADLKPDGGAFSYQDPCAEFGLKVYTQYDADGNLTGLRAE